MADRREGHASPAVSASAVRLVVIKSIRACNLRRPYCYYINDSTPNYGSAISEATMRRFYAAVAAYLEPGARFEFVWHGGEPMLLGKRRFRALIEAQGDYLRREQAFNVMQTNGTLIDREWAELLTELGVGVGISLDGPPHVHDRRRPTTKNHGSYAQARRGIEVMRAAGHKVGALCVMDPQANGAEVLGHFREIGIPLCDFLIPITNNGIEAGPGTFATDHVAADGLRRFACSAFDAWISGGPATLSVRLFESLIKNALGVPHGDLNAGSRNIAQNLILETDGSICLDPDFWYIDRFGLGSMYKTGCSVHDPDFSLHDVARRLDAFATFHGLRSVPSECQKCSMRSVCRGSHPASRFGADGSFDHRSAYCDLMFALSAAAVDYLWRGGLAAQFSDPDLVSALTLINEERSMNHGIDSIANGNSAAA